ncbi:MAG: DUF2807 domain-containing protein [Lewinellaceae bacterium]|nr:DUF2807 domain-containing protein [Lewinellaceae bacterium]
MKHIIFCGLLCLAIYSQAIGQNRGALTGNGKSTVLPLPSIEPFTEIEIIDVNANTEVVVGPATSLRIEVDENLAKLIEVKQKNGKITLSIPSNPNNKLWIEDSHTKIFIQTPALESILVDDNGYCSVSGIQAEIFSVKKYDNITLRLEGRTQELNIVKTGNGDVLAEDLLAENAKVLSSGNGSVRLNVSQEISANRSGNGSVINTGAGKVEGVINVGNGNVSGAMDREIASEQPPAPRVAFTLVNKSMRRKTYVIRGEGFSYGIGIGPLAQRKEELPAGTKIQTNLGQTVYTVRVEDAGQKVDVD